MRNPQRQEKPESVHKAQVKGNREVLQRMQRASTIARTENARLQKELDDDRAATAEMRKEVALEYTKRSLEERARLNTIDAEGDVIPPAPESPEY